MKPSGDESHSRIINCRKVTRHIEASFGISAVPMLRQALKRIKTEVAGRRVFVKVTPPAETLSAVDPEFQVVEGF